MISLAILGRGLLPRWRAGTVIVLGIFAFLLSAIAIVDSMDASIFDAYPPALRALAGIPVGADAAILAYNQMLAFIGAITVAGFAVAIGAQAIAGEERDRTLPMLLSHPVSRANVALTRAAVLILAMAATSAALWGAGELAAVLLGMPLGNAHLGELCLALGANALLCGAVAFAVGGATGSHPLAAATGSAVLALGWLLSGLLPMWSETKDAARYVPWYWYTEPEVLINGLDGSSLALMLGVAGALLVTGVAGFVLRDLRFMALRLWPGRERAVRAVTEGMTKSSRRTPSFAGLMLARHGALVVVVGAILFGFMGLAMGPMYEQMAPELATMMRQMPSDLLQMWGAGDMSTPAGFYWGETMGLMAPAGVIVAGVAVASGFGRDEESGRLAPTLAAPRPRWRILLAMIAVQVFLVAVVSALTGLGIWGGVRLGGLDLSAANIAGATAHLLALGLFLGATATVAVAATGRASAGVWAGAGIGVAGYVVNAALPMIPETAEWARISPFYWYASAQPLDHGAGWSHVALLGGGAVLLLAASVPLFARRDLRV